MILSISLIVILSIAVLSLFERVRLWSYRPGIAWNSFGTRCNESNRRIIALISDEVRLLALIVILMRAGLGLNRRIIKKIGPWLFVFIFFPASSKVSQSW